MGTGGSARTSHAGGDRGFAPPALLASAASPAVAPPAGDAVGKRRLQEAFLEQHSPEHAPVRSGNLLEPFALGEPSSFAVAHPACVDLHSRSRNAREPNTAGFLDTQAPSGIRPAGTRMGTMGADGSVFLKVFDRLKTNTRSFR